MKKQMFKTLSIALSLSTILNSTLSAFAYNVDENGNSIEEAIYQTSDEEDFSNVTNVFAELGSVYKVTIPKTIVLSGKNKKANYFVKVNGDIAGYETINVVPDKDFLLYTENKNSQTAFVSQDKTAWTYSTLGIDANGLVEAEGITAGKWQGMFNFNINMNKVAGDVIAPDHEHTWEIFEVIRDATCSEEGQAKYICPDCLSTKTDVISKLEHTADTAVKENEVQPTCETVGTYEDVIYCTVCGEEISRTHKTIDALGHDWKVATEVDATCEADSTEAKVCTRCGETNVTHNTKKLGHITDTSKDVITQPTCTTQGYTTHTCTRCSKTYVDIYKDALGHNYVNGKCSRCGDFDMSKMAPGLYTVSGVEVIQHIQLSILGSSSLTKNISISIMVFL